MRLKASQLAGLGGGMHADKANNLYFKVTGEYRGWIFRAVANGKRKTMSLGRYPLISLKEARDLAFDAARRLEAGEDPFATKNRQKEIPTFADAAKQVWQENLEAWSNGKHTTQWLRTLELYAYPAIGDMRVDQITHGDVRDLLAPIWLSKAETADRVLQRVTAVLDWAMARGFTDRELPVRAIKRGLPKRPKRQKGHHAAIDWRHIPEFMFKLEMAEGTGARALEFAILTAARSGEVRGMTWAEVDGDIWSIPADRMKARRGHNVPLSEPALDLLERQRKLHRELTGQDPKPEDLVFTGLKAGQPMSDMTLAAVLKRMGRSDITVHGFRSAFRDWVSEATNHSGELAESALAHTIANQVEAAYRRGDLLEKRRKLMADWAAYAKKLSLV